MPVDVMSQQNTYAFTRRPPESTCILFLFFCLSLKIRTPGSNLFRHFAPFNRLQPGEGQENEAGVRRCIQWRAERVWPTAATHALPLFCRS